MFEARVRKIDAILSLAPNAEVVIRGDTVEWVVQPPITPTLEEINAEIIRLEAEAKATEYRRLRAKEYPPMADYLDAVVKGDEAQKQAYIDACLAVKAKYPKGAA